MTVNKFCNVTGDINRLHIKSFLTLLRALKALFQGIPEYNLFGLCSESVWVWRPTIR
jgi:hypothetical protein